MGLNLLQALTGITGPHRHDRPSQVSNNYAPNTLSTSSLLRDTDLILGPKVNGQMESKLFPVYTQIKTDIPFTFLV